MTQENPNNIEHRVKFLEKENALLKNIIEHANISIFAIDEHLEVIIYNKASEKLEGMKKNQVLGRKEEDVYPGYNWTEIVTQKILSTGKPIIEQSYVLTLPNGQTFNTIFSSYPYYHDGKIASIFSFQKKVDDGKNYFTTRPRYGLEDMIGDSPPLREVIVLATRVAKNNSNVLIYGETGTGKEILAQGIHNASEASGGPFIPINCAAIPDTLLESMLFGTVKGAFTGARDNPGLFEQAENGTIFLDEINSMHQSLQAKLLRVLQDKVVRRIGSNEDKQVNCRIISATNMDPNMAVEKKHIRSDLYYRLAAVSIEVPPLRKRKEDIHKLAVYFIQNYNLSFGLRVEKICPKLLTLFENYEWPGNVRELKNFIESGMNFVDEQASVLERDHLPRSYCTKLDRAKKSHHVDALGKEGLAAAIDAFEKNIIETKLYHNHGNITKTAEELGISRQNLYYKMKKLSINEEF